MVDTKAGFEPEHASVEIRRGPWPYVSRPLDPVRALLAVSNLVLQRMAPPRLLVEAVHHGVKTQKTPSSEVEQVVYIALNLGVTIQLYIILLYSTNCRFNQVIM